MKKILSFILGAVCMLGAHSAKAQGIAVRTNVFDWAICVPNVGVDLVINEYLSFDVNVLGTIPHVSTFSGVPSYFRQSEVMGGQVELRYWFSHQPYENFFLGLQAMPMHYKTEVSHGADMLNTATNKNEYVKTKFVHDGVALPLGFNFGYSLPINHKLSLEFCYGAGWIFSNNSCAVKESSKLKKNGYNIPASKISHNCDFSTTNIGVNITYILK